MPRPLRFVPANSVVEITTRTLQGRLLLRPSPGALLNRNVPPDAPTSNGSLMLLQFPCGDCAATPGSTARTRFTDGEATGGSGVACAATDGRTVHSHDVYVRVEYFSAAMEALAMGSMRNHRTA